MVFVLKITGNREDLDTIEVKNFLTTGLAQNYCDQINTKQDEKYYEYAEIIELTQTTTDYKSVG